MELLSVIDYSSQGAGVAKKGDEVFFIDNALIGELVDAEVIKKEKGINYCKSIRVEIPSINRAVPKCKYFNLCGGCDIQHMNYDEQLLFKKNNVKRILKKVASLETGDVEIVPSSDNYRYRNKIQLPVRMVKNRSVVGFFKKRSHDIVEIDDCLICQDWVKSLIKVMKSYFLQSKDTAYSEENRQGNIKHIIARSVCGETSIVIVSSEGKLKNDKLLIELLDCEAKPYNLFINTNKSAHSENLVGDIKLLKGKLGQIQTFLGVSSKVSPMSFMQVNDEIKALLYQYVISQAGKGRLCIDAYCGGGVMSAMLSKNFEQVVGVEIVKEAIQDAVELVKNSQITNCKFFCGKCEDMLQNNLSEDSVLVLDPPKKGCDICVCNAILRNKPQKIIYVSCEPNTLARDIKNISGEYIVESLKLFDMFPNTTNVESVVVLKRREK